MKYNGGEERMSEKERQKFDPVGMDDKNRNIFDKKK